MDVDTVQQILHFDPTLSHQQACGGTPINGLLLAARHHHLHAGDRIYSGPRLIESTVNGRQGRIGRGIHVDNPRYLLRYISSEEISLRSEEHLVLPYL